MHNNMWMCGQMHPLAPRLAISRVAYSLYIHRHGLYVLPLMPQHYDSNAPLLGHLVDAGAMGRQTTNRRRHSNIHVHVHGWAQLGLLT